MTGPDGRFSLPWSGRRGPMLSCVRAGSRKAARRFRRRRLAGPSTSRSSRPRVSETVTVTATRERAAARRRAGQRQRARAASDIRQSPAVVADDVLRQVPTFSLFRRTSSLVVASDRAGRVAARHRPERRQPHAGAARRRAVQRSVRRLGLLDARAARERRSHRGCRRRELEPLRQLRDGRRDQLVSGAGGAADARVADAVRQPRQPEVRRRRPATSGASSASSVDGSAVRHRRLSRSSRRASAGGRQQRRRWTYGNVNVKLDYDATDRVQRVRPRRLLPRGAQQRQGAARSTAPTEANDTEWTSVSGGVRLRLPIRATLQATLFVRRRDVPQQLPGGAGRHAAAQHRAHDAESARADQWRRRHGCSGRARSAASTCFTRRHRLALGRRRQRGGRRSTRRPGTQRHAAARVSGGTQRSFGALRPGHHHADVEADAHARARASISWRNYDGHNLETNVPSGTPTAEQQARRCPIATTPSSARAWRRSTTHRPRQRLGRASARVSARRRSTSSTASSASAPC